ncbi:MAG: response regulator transcription factor [Gemmatimonadaceae bacterium]
MITVLVATDSQLLRQLLCDALNGRSGLSVVATAPDHPRALALTENLRPDVAIVNMGMPESLILVRALAGVHARVVSLGRCEEESVAVVEDGTLNDVIAAVHGAMHGAFTPTRSSDSELDHLTATERLVLRSVNEGHSNKEIAQELGVAVPTIKHHVHSLLTKLGVRRRGEAAAIYRRTRSESGRSTRPSPRWTVRPSSSRPS